MTFEEAQKFMDDGTFVNVKVCKERIDSITFKSGLPPYATLSNGENVSLCRLSAPDTVGISRETVAAFLLEIIRLAEGQVDTDGQVLTKDEALYRIQVKCQNFIGY